jgi:hypothetical protein
MDLAESGINQKAVTKGHTEIAKSTLPSSFEMTFFRFRTTSYSRRQLGTYNFQQRRDDSLRRRIITNEKKVVCSYEVYMLHVMYE